MKQLASIFVICILSLSSFSQTETLTNSEVVMMTKAGLSKELIIRKIKESKGKYETTAQALVELKKAGVADDVIGLMFDKKPPSVELQSSAENRTEINIGYSKNIPIKDDSAHVVLSPIEALRSAKTVSIEKSSINPSRQALEKELLKLKEWKALNLNLVEYKRSSDLKIDIGFVPFSLITHRYVWRVYDNKSGTVIAAGETTSWGNLSKNLARQISKKLQLELNQNSDSEKNRRKTEYPIE